MGKIGGNSRLSERGERYSRALADYIHEQVRWGRGGSWTDPRSPPSSLGSAVLTVGCGGSLCGVLWQFVCGWE